MTPVQIPDPNYHQLVRMIREKETFVSAKNLETCSVTGLLPSGSESHLALGWLHSHFLFFCFAFHGVYKIIRFALLQDKFVQVNCIRSTLSGKFHCTNRSTNCDSFIRRCEPSTWSFWPSISATNGTWWKYIPFRSTFSPCDMMAWSFMPCMNLHVMCEPYWGHHRKRIQRAISTCLRQTI